MAIKISGSTIIDDSRNIVSAGVVTATSAIVGAAVTINVTGINVTGIITASSFKGSGANLTGIVSGVGVATAGGTVGTGATILDFRGAGISTVTVASGIATINITGGSGGVTEIKTLGITTTSAIGVGSFATATYRSAAVFAQINQNAQYQIGQYLMIHDGATVTVIEQAAVSTGSSMLGSFTGIINGTNAELKVSMVSSGIATVTTKIDTVTV